MCRCKLILGRAYTINKMSNKNVGGLNFDISSVSSVIVYVIVNVSLGHSFSSMQSDKAHCQR